MKKGDIIIIVAGLLIMLTIFIVYQVIIHRAGDDLYVSIRYKKDEIHRVDITEDVNLEILVVEGKVIEIIDRNVEPDKAFTITESHYNIVKIYNNGVQVIEADCPSQDDVLKGFTARPYDVILCAPHFLEVEIRANQQNNDPYDGLV